MLSPINFNETSKLPKIEVFLNESIMLIPNINNPHNKIIELVNPNQTLSLSLKKKFIEDPTQNRVINTKPEMALKCSTINIQFDFKLGFDLSCFCKVEPMIRKIITQNNAISMKLSKYLII